MHTQSRRQSIKTINLNLAERSYPIWIDYGITDKIVFLLRSYKNTKWIVFTQKSIFNYWNNRITSILDSNGIDYKVIFLKEGEEAKSIDSVSKIYNELIQIGCNRQTIFLGIGGGVVGDTTGFIASTFMRGVSYFQVPTSMLSMVDSSIGGKTAINTSRGKNMVGSFYQPKGVIIDPDFLETIAEKEIFSAMSEVAKYSILFDKNFFSYLNKNLEKIIDRDQKTLMKIISKCCEFKANVVSIDEFDNGKRKFLNFGHTFGHALEFNSNLKIDHGQSVAYGILFATFYSFSQKKLSKKNFDKIFNFFNKIHLPKLSKLKFSSLLRLMKNDKKNDDGINFVLIKDMGQPYIEKINDRKIIKYLEGFYEHISYKWTKP